MDYGRCGPTLLDLLKLSLVTIAVRPYSATTEKERIYFHGLYEYSGERVRYPSPQPRNTGLGDRVHEPVFIDSGLGSRGRAGMTVFPSNDADFCLNGTVD